MWGAYAASEVKRHEAAFVPVQCQNMNGSRLSAILE